MAGSTLGSVGLREKREEFLLTVVGGLPKITTSERVASPELLFFHEKTKEMFAQDRIRSVLHHVRAG